MHLLLTLSALYFILYHLEDKFKQIQAFKNYFNINVLTVDNTLNNNLLPFVKDRKNRDGDKTRPESASSKLIVLSLH